MASWDCGLDATNEFVYAVVLRCDSAALMTFIGSARLPKGYKLNNRFVSTLHALNNMTMPPLDTTQHWAISIGIIHREGIATATLHHLITTACCKKSAHRNKDAERDDGEDGDGSEQQVCDVCNLPAEERDEGARPIS